MSVIWAHDHKFYKYNDKVYSKVEFPSSLWDRYLKFTPSLKVISRLYELEEYDIENIKNFNISSSPNVDFTGVDYSGKAINYFKDYRSIKDKVTNEIKESEKVIVRLPSLIGTVVGFEAIKQKKALLVELVGDPWDAYTSLPSKSAKIYAALIYWQTKQIIKHANQVLYVTKYYLQNRYPNNNEDNINASNVNIKVNHKSPKRLKRKKTVEIGTIAFLSPYKGIDTAIEALAELNSNKTIEYRLTILGTGDRHPYESLASKLGVKEFLTFKTVPSGKPVLDWLDSLDLYIQPSRTEGLPRGLVEAMSQGLPSVGSKAGGIPELLSAEYIFDIGNSGELTNKIEYLLSDEERYLNTSLENLEKVKEYDSEFLNQKRDKFYKKFLEDEFNESY